MIPPWVWCFPAEAGNESKESALPQSFLVHPQIFEEANLKYILSE